MDTTKKTFRLALISALLLIFMWGVIPGVIGTKLVEAEILPQHWQSVVQGLLFSGVLIPILLLIRYKFKDTKTIDFGIGALKSISIQFFKGCGLIFIPFLLTIIITSVLGFNDYQLNPNPLVLQGLLIGFIGVILYESLPEELLFRGFLFGGLRSRLGKWTASIITVFLFTLWPLIAVPIQSAVFGVEPSIGMTGSITMGYMINMLLFGAFTIFLRNMTGSIWMGVGFHSFFVYMNYFIGQTEYSLFQVVGNGGDLPGQITLLICFIITFATVSFISYRKKKRTEKATIDYTGVHLPLQQE